MKLDLEKIASARRVACADIPTKNHSISAGMRFLMEHIRRDIEQRISESLDKSTANKVNALVVDFDDGEICFPGIENPIKMSLLEGGNPGISGFQSIESGTYDYLVINSQSAWFDFAELIHQVWRILKPGGAFYFSTFGPDTLIEIEQAWQKVDEYTHRHRLTDMHHLGDSLLQSGFIKPILDADWIFVDYPTPEILLADLKKEGFVNIQSDRRKSLTGKYRFKAFLGKLKEISQYGDLYKMTCEIVYGYAMKPEVKQGAIKVNPPVLIEKTPR